VPTAHGTRRSSSRPSCAPRKRGGCSRENKPPRSCEWMSSSHRRPRTTAGAATSMPSSPRREGLSHQAEPECSSPPRVSVPRDQVDQSFRSVPVAVHSTGAEFCSDSTRNGSKATLASTTQVAMPPIRKTASAAIVLFATLASCQRASNQNSATPDNNTSVASPQTHAPAPSPPVSPSEDDFDVDTVARDLEPVIRCVFDVHRSKHSATTRRPRAPNNPAVIPPRRVEDRLRRARRREQPATSMPSVAGEGGAINMPGRSGLGNRVPTVAGPPPMSAAPEVELGRARPAHRPPVTFPPRPSITLCRTNVTEATCLPGSRYKGGIHTTILGPERRFAGSALTITRDRVRPHVQGSSPPQSRARCLRDATDLA